MKAFKILSFSQSKENEKNTATGGGGSGEKKKTKKPRRGFFSSPSNSIRLRNTVKGVPSDETESFSASSSDEAVWRAGKFSWRRIIKWL